MIGLIAIRDAIAANGAADLKQLCRQFNQPEPLMRAMLKQLETMEVIACSTSSTENACLPNQCKGCPDGQRCQTETWQLKN